MALSSFFECFLCGRGQKVAEDRIPAYDVESKLPGISIDSQDSSDAESRKLEFESSATIVAESEVIPTTPKTNRALVVASKRTYGLVEEVFPEFKNEDEVIIKSVAVGLNPIDWKSVDFNFCLPEFPWITGREMAGVVEKVGANVKDIKVGDKVWTSTYYRDRRAGCFQQYVTVPSHTVLPIPSNLSYTSAACLGVAALTSSMALWKWLQVPQSPEEVATMSTDGYLLVWGGSAVTGQFAIQIAARSGLKVIAVTSSKTQALAQKLGATHVVSRDGKTGDEIVAEIRSLTGDNVTRAIDLVGTETAPFCLQAMSKTQPCLFAPLAMISSSTPVPENVTMETVEMKQFVNDASSKAYAVELNRLIEEGGLVLPEIEVLEGGLDVIVAGLERVKRGDMAGKKMVVMF